MMAVSPQTSPPSASAFSRSRSDLPIRRLFADDEDDSDITTASLPSVKELLQQVSRLQADVRKLGPYDDISGDGGDTDSLDGRATATDTSVMRRRISSRQSSFTSNLNTSFSSDTGAPPRHITSRYATPGTRVAALTKENISLLRAPLDHRRSANFEGGSVCGSQKSRTSVRTDGGAVFSRLYQPDFYKTRDAKLKSIRDRQDSFNFSFLPKTNNRTSVCSRDSAASSSIGSIRSAKTDILNVSSRLYDPDYMRKRTAKLQKMREERELRSCTFTPTVNAASAAATALRRSSAVPARK